MKEPVEESSGKFDRRLKEAGLYHTSRQRMFHYKWLGFTGKDAWYLVRNDFRPEAIMSIKHGGTWEKLKDASKDRTTATATEITTWCLNHLATPPEDIDPSTIPSCGAVAMLQLCQGDDKAKIVLLTKGMPNQTALKNDSDFSTDSTQGLGLLDRMIKAKEMAQR